MPLTDRGEFLPQLHIDDFDKWLNKNNIPYNEIIAGPGSKKEKCIKNKLDIMIEDKASNVESISDANPVLCFDAPYNLHVDKENVTRVYSWYQIYDHFLNIKTK